MLTAENNELIRKMVSPMPIKHQMVGGGGDQFVPTQLLQLYMRDLSNKLVPMAMLNGELTAQGLRCFCVCSRR